MKNSKIGWTEDTLNPIVGCTKVSEGCANCYAEAMNKRFHWVKDWNKPEFFPKRLEQLNPKQKPRRIFLCSLSDMFHEDMNLYDDVNPIIIKIRECKQHTFLILTKRSKRMHNFFDWEYLCKEVNIIPNLLLGVTVESDKYLNRIDDLLDTPAAKRFVSFEPLLSEIIIPDEKLCKLDWAIIGCESGSKRRECKDEWVESLINQCEQAEVPVFLKQLMQNGKLIKEPYFNGRQYMQYPESEVKSE